MFLKWFEKLSRARGIPNTPSENIEEYKILQSEFSRFMPFGFSTIEEALSDLDWTKDPGFPWDCTCKDNLQAWEKYGRLILIVTWYILVCPGPIDLDLVAEWYFDHNLHPYVLELLDCMLNGQEVPIYARASQKDELNLADKCTRIFCPFPLHHRLATAVCCKKQCDRLIETCLQHPSAVGLKLPGNGLNVLLAKLKKFPDGYDFDHTGMDTGMADVEPICRFFMDFMPEWLFPAFVFLFATAYHASVIVDGWIYVASFNPSGWYLTTMMNTFKLVKSVVRGCAIICTEVPPIVRSGRSYPDWVAVRWHLEVFGGGDDGAYSTDLKSLNIVRYAQWAATKGMYLETEYSEPRDPLELTFYAHRLTKLHSTFYRRTFLVPVTVRLGKRLSGLNYETDRGALENAVRLLAISWDLIPFIDHFREVWPFILTRINYYYNLAGCPRGDPVWESIYSGFPTVEGFITRVFGRLEGSEGFSFSFPSILHPIKRLDPESIVHRFKIDHASQAQVEVLWHPAEDTISL